MMTFLLMFSCHNRGTAIGQSQSSLLNHHDYHVYLSVQVEKKVIDQVPGLIFLFSYYTLGFNNILTYPVW